MNVQLIACSRAERQQQHHTKSLAVDAYTHEHHTPRHAYLVTLMAPPQRPLVLEKAASPLLLALWSVVLRLLKLALDRPW